MTALPAIVSRLRHRAVIIDRRGHSAWCVGTGRMASGFIDRDLSTFPDQPAARAAAIELGDKLDLMVVSND